MADEARLERRALPIPHPVGVENLMSSRNRGLWGSSRRLTEFHVNDGATFGLQVVRQAADGNGVERFYFGSHAVDSRLKSVFMDSPDPYDRIPDVRDGLTREERVVLYVLHQTQKERGDRNVPTAMLWGRVCEYFYISPEALSDMLARLGARK